MRRCRSLCADLGSHKQLPGGDGVRRRLLSYAALHCPPTRMPLLLEELREVERRMEQTAGAAGAAAWGMGQAVQKARETSPEM